MPDARPPLECRTVTLPGYGPVSPSTMFRAVSHAFASGTPGLLCQCGRAYIGGSGTAVRAVEEFSGICQVTGLRTTALLCSEVESGGYRCENTTVPHTQHFVGFHTIAHDRAGNGYTCEGIEDMLKSQS
jgi:hypothetical protein